MKKIISLVSLFAVILVTLTGCVTIDYGLKINSDGSGTISYVYAFEKSFIESMGESMGDMELSAETMSADMKKTAEEQGYSVTVYSDDTLEGIQATKEIKDVRTEFSLEEIFGEEVIQDKNESTIKIENGKYSQQATLNLTEQEDMSMYGMGGMVLQYTVTLPIKAGKNNATSVSDDGKTLTWVLNTGEENKIEFEASKNSTLLFAAIGGGVLLTALIVVIVITSKRKKTRTDVTNNTDVENKPEEDDTDSINNDNTNTDDSNNNTDTDNI